MTLQSASFFKKMFQYSMNGTRLQASILFDVSLDLRNVQATKFMHVALNMWTIHIIQPIISMNSLITQKNWRKQQQRYGFLLLISNWALLFFSLDRLGTKNQKLNTKRQSCFFFVVDSISNSNNNKRLWLALGVKYLVVLSLADPMKRTHNYRIYLVIPYTVC